MQRMPGDLMTELFEERRLRREAEAKLAKRPRRRAQPVRHEGVAMYRCDVLTVNPDDDVAVGDDFEEADLHFCMRTQEAKPYTPVPVCHDLPMTLVGYDWARDVEV